MAAVVVGPARGGATRATPSREGGSSMCSVATARTTVRPTSFMSLTQVVSSPSRGFVLRFLGPVNFLSSSHLLDFALFFDDVDLAFR